MSDITDYGQPDIALDPSQEQTQNGTSGKSIIQERIDFYTQELNSLGNRLQKLEVEKQQLQSKALQHVGAIEALRALLG